MTCFEFRRLILASPRERSAAQEQHKAACAACAALAREMDNFESRIHEAALVPMPEALAERVLLRGQVERQRSRLRVWAFAATVMLALGLGLVLVRDETAPPDGVRSAAALGEAHPAVAAISYVIDEEPRLLAENRFFDPAAMRQALADLGLNLPAENVAVRYLGKCPVPGGSGEHVVLTTPFGQVSLILVPDLPFGPRVLVWHRDRAALARAQRAGGYILVGDTVATVTQLEKLLL